MLSGLCFETQEVPPLLPPLPPLLTLTQSGCLKTPQCHFIIYSVCVRERERKDGDTIWDDLQTIAINEKERYEVATTSRREWRTICNTGFENYVNRCPSQQRAPRQSVTCVACQRTFHREGDRKRHKCIQERMKPVSQQRGAAPHVTDGS